MLRRLVERVPGPEVGGISPVRLVEVELSEPLRPIPAEGCSLALVLVSLHWQPLGTVAVELGERPVSPSELREAIDRAIGGQVRAHLHRDGLADVLDSAWDGRAETPPCLQD